MHHRRYATEEEAATAYDCAAAMLGERTERRFNYSLGRAQAMLPSVINKPFFVRLAQAASESGDACPGPRPPRFRGSSTSGVGHPKQQQPQQQPQRQRSSGAQQAALGFGPVAEAPSSALEDAMYVAVESPRSAEAGPAGPAPFSYADAYMVRAGMQRLVLNCMRLALSQRGTDCDDHRHPCCWPLD